MKTHGLVSFHTNRDEDGKVSSYLVIVPDEALKLLNFGHPLRALYIAFNGFTRPSQRLAALAEALRGAEDRGIAYPGLWAVICSKVKNLFVKRHPDEVLVDRFAAALKKKLARARGLGRHGWQASDWMDSCRVSLVEHVMKGDPLDVANFCAFLWHHGQMTSTAIACFNAENQSEPGKLVTKIVHRRLAPRIVCLCGSTRFSDAFRDANLRETIGGNIVLSIGCDTKSDDTLLAGLPPTAKAQLKDRLDTLHLRKIDLADEILVLNVGGYVDDSTNKEIAYAREHGKRVRWLEPQHANAASDLIREKKS